MEFTSLLVKSFDLLRDHPKLSLPFIINQFIFYIIVFSLYSLNFSEGLEVSNVTEVLEYSIYFIVGLLAWFVLSTIFSSWGYYQNSQFVSNKTTSLSKSFFTSLKYALKLFLVRITYFIIVLIPTFIFIGLATSLFFIHILIGIAGVLLFSALIIVWILFISVRLLYAEASIYFDNTLKLSPFYYVKKAYRFSKKRSGSIILVVLTIIVIHAFVNTITSNPFTSVILAYFKSYQMMIYYFLAIISSVILAIITGSTSAFTNILILKSYRDFEKEKKEDLSNK